MRVVLSKLPATKFCAAPGEWGVHAGGRFLRPGSPRLCVVVFQLRVPTVLFVHQRQKPEAPNMEPTGALCVQN